MKLTATNEALKAEVKLLGGEIVSLQKALRAANLQQDDANAMLAEMKGELAEATSATTPLSNACSFERAADIPDVVRRVASTLSLSPLIKPYNVHTSFTFFS